jgi:hypothetical protein
VIPVIRRVALSLCVLALVLSVMGARSLAEAARATLGPLGWARWFIRVPEGASGAADLLRLAREQADTAPDTILPEASLWATLTGLRPAACRIVATTAAYPAFEALRLRVGAFFTAEHAKLRDRVVVLDQDLARALFGSVDVVGLPVEAWGQRYRVVGVTEPMRGAPSWLLGASAPTAYIPLGSLPERLDVSHCQLQISREAPGPPEALLRAAGLDPASFDITDSEESGRLLSQAGRTPALLAAFVAVGLLAAFGVRLARETYRQIRAELRHSYLPEVLRTRIGMLVLRSAALTAGLAAAAIVVRLTVFLPYAPPRWIPSSLTDLPFYADLLRDRMAAWLHGLDGAEPAPTRYRELCGRLAFLLGPASLAAAAGVAATCRGLWLPAALSLLAAVPLAAGLLALAGLPVSLEVGPPGALWLLVLAGALRGAGHGGGGCRLRPPGPPGRHR